MVELSKKICVKYFDEERNSCSDLNKIIDALPQLEELELKHPFSKEELKSFRKLGSMLQGHPDMKGVPGVDMSTGSLGQGLSAANGMALASKIDSKGYRVYALLGDGEIEEGQIWEAAMTSSHYKLDNLCVIVDNNNLQMQENNKQYKNYLYHL